LTRFLFKGPPCLTSLPNELLDHIFDSYDTSYILPPINSRLLPFHQSQLFRSPILTESKYRRFKVALDSNEKLKDYVRAFELEFRPMASRKPVQVSPTRQNLSEVLASLPNLESFTLRARPQIIHALLPSIEHFKKNPKLTSILAKPWVEGSALVGLDWRDAFRCSKTHDAQDEEGLDDLIGNSADDVLGPLVFEVTRQRDSSTFGLRYCAYMLFGKDFEEAFRALPITNLQITLLAPPSNLSDFLSCLADPSALQHLSLMLLNPGINLSSTLLHVLATFTGLEHLSYSGRIFPSSSAFFDILRQLPLKSLEFGPNSDVDVQALTILLSHRRQPARIDLKRLILNNFEADVPEDEEDADVGEWTVPEWTETCSKEGVEKLRIVAKGLGIETAGTTFLGLNIEDSEAYQDALEREEEEESEEESDEEEEEESYYRRGHGGYRDYDDDSDSDYHAERHEDVCGCHHSYRMCWKYADMQGWERRYYGRRRY